MTPEQINGANYGEYYPSGAGGTNLTLPPGYPDDLAMFTRLPPDATAYAAKGHSSFNVYLWTGTKWIIVYTGDTDNFPVAFHPTTGELYVAAANVYVYDRVGTLVRTIPGNVGSNGIRRVNPDGSIVTGDNTRGIVASGVQVLGNYTPVGNLSIGQGMHGGIDAWDGKLLRHICDGNPQIFNINDDANGRVAIYFTDLTNGQLLQTTVADILAIPGVDPSQPVGPTTPPRTADGRVYEVSGFIKCDPAVASRGGTGQQDNVQVDRPDGIILYGKFGSAGAYEMYAVDANWEYSLEDASGPTESQSWTDPRFWPMQQAIGMAHAFVTGQHEAVYKDRNTCQELRRVPFNRKMWIEALYDGFYWGPDLGNKPTLVRGYDPTAGYYAKDRIIEVRYESFGAGWCRWEAHRSDLVYPGVTSYPDPEWMTRPAVFSEATLVQRVDFYLVGGPDVQPVLTGCVPPIVPSYPPLSANTLEKIKMQAFNGFAKVAVLNGGPYYTGVDPSTHGPKNVYYNRPGEPNAGGEWETLLFTPHSDGGWDGLYVSAGLQLSLQDDGTFQTRPKGTYGPYENLQIRTESGTGRLLIYRTMGGGSVMLGEVKQ